MPKVAAPPRVIPMSLLELAEPAPPAGLRARFRAAPLSWRVFGIAVALQLPLIALYLLNAAAIHGKFLDINQEGNPFTWFRSMQYFVAAVACAIPFYGVATG